MTDSLNVYWELRLAGRLWLDEKRDFFFQYAPSWLSAADSSPLSLRLPLKPDPFGPEYARPFFSNLLPEAGVRARIARGLGVSEANDFKLLEELAGDCAGALSLIPEGASPQSDGRYQAISSKELDLMIEEMPQRPLLTAREGLRLSLAGAQEKIPVFIKDGDLLLPSGSCSSSHILKPAIPQFPNTVENEAFCMALARECGLPVPQTTIRIGPHRAYLIERYDRRPGPDGALIRVQQEDFCQALGIDHDLKYEGEGGPNLGDCFALIDAHSAAPLPDKHNLLRLVVFNYLIGNCDAHAKNLSLLFSDGGVRLAPFYDLLSTCAYPKLSPKLAMRLGGQLRPEWVAKEHWRRLAAEANVGAKAILAICEELGEEAPAKARTLAAGFIARYGVEETLGRILKHVETMSRNMLDRLKHA